MFANTDILSKIINAYSKKSSQSDQFAKFYFLSNNKKIDF